MPRTWSFQTKACRAGDAGELPHEEAVQCLSAPAPCSTETFLLFHALCCLSAQDFT